MAETREQILDAAESLFAKHGIEAVPLRRIIAEAGVNSAAIHYHFGSKEELVRAVFARRFDPINRARIDLLNQAEQSDVEGRPSVEVVLYAMVAPPFRLESGNEAGVQYRRLAGRLFTERSGYLEVMFNDLFREVERRFNEALTKALPDLPNKERSWRTYMAMGSMIFILREQEWIGKASGGLCCLEHAEISIQRLVQFMAAGLKAPLLDVSPTSDGAELFVPVERGSR